MKAIPQSKPYKGMPAGRLTVVDTCMDALLVMFLLTLTKICDQLVMIDYQLKVIFFPV